MDPELIDRLTTYKILYLSNHKYIMRMTRKRARKARTRKSRTFLLKTSRKSGKSGKAGKARTRKSRTFLLKSRRGGGRIEKIKAKLGHVYSEWKKRQVAAERARKEKAEGYKAREQKVNDQESGLAGKQEALAAADAIKKTPGHKAAMADAMSVGAMREGLRASRLAQATGRP